ncbi:ubiquitin domain-containing protein UBFD1 isoform X2 [Hoplias malabaricus]|uniref:ubiquitin domain-containing protein UBFD1 isoform X2 n=1 Tax=Hoplias malabaricus TaxID=27720 RepID=UPI00346305E0
MLTGSEGLGMETEVSLKDPEVLCEDASKGDTAGVDQASLIDGENSSLQVPAISNGDDSDEGKEMVEVKIIWNKNKYDLKIPLDGTGAKLKEKIHTLTGLPPAMQKVMYKGLLPEDKTLREIKVTNGAKIMVVGSTINDVLAVNTPKEVIQQEVKAEENKKEPLCRQKQHRKVLDKGKPEDIMPSIKGTKERLPTVPLSGMYNKSGGKVRLTFKLEQDQLWIGTKERTEKIPMGSIKNVVTEPIEGHEDYHMMRSSVQSPRRPLPSQSGSPKRAQFASPSLSGHFSWVQQKPHNIGFIGCLHSMLMQSKTQSLENGSIFNVPPLLTLKNWDIEQTNKNKLEPA